jgi:glycosyltransferase involved in cell wall biosynthesis
MTTEQVEEAALVAGTKTYDGPLKVLFSGRLVPDKQVAHLLRGVGLALERGIDLALTVVGDGPQRRELQSLVHELQLGNRVQFTGAVDFDENLKWYRWADCLVLPSQSEGWPKVIAEAMCHGVICIATDSGNVVRMLEGRGIVLRDGGEDDIARAIQEIAADPGRYRPMTERAVKWASQYSMDDLRMAIADLLEKEWRGARVVPGLRETSLVSTNGDVVSTSQAVARWRANR